MRAIFSALALCAALLNTPLASAQTAAKPNPALSPREVVQLQLDALQEVDRPVKDAGFATVFGFASPQNREQTGSLLQFSQMLRQGFGEMINHKSAQLSPTLQEQDRALQPVELTSRSGRHYRYVFVLRRQIEGPYRGCWMTDGVIPQDATGQSQEL